MTIQRQIKSPDFDSELAETSGADNDRLLTIVLRIALVQANPNPTAPSRRQSCAKGTIINRIRIGSDWVQDRHRRVFRISKWTSSAFNQYLTRFKQNAESIWNDRIFILFPDPQNSTVAIPVADFRALQNALLIGKKTPFLRCRLRIDGVQENQRHHAKMHVLCLVPGQICKFQAFVARRPGEADEGFLTNQDSAQTSAHEVGHMLDLPHVNHQHPTCQQNRDADICYGSHARQVRDVMGTGTVVHGAHAKTWLKAIELHTHHSLGWQATHINPPIDRLMRQVIGSGP